MLIEIRKKPPLKRGGTYEEEYYIEYDNDYGDSDIKSGCRCRYIYVLEAMDRIE